MRALTVDAVKRMALAHGGKAEIDGKAVNAARLQAVTKAPAPVAKGDSAYMPPESKPAPTQTIQPDPVVREAMVSIDHYAASQFMLNEQLAQAVKSALATSAPAPDKRPVQWVFKIKRDAQGLMDTITATAKYQE